MPNSHRRTVNCLADILNLLLASDSGTEIRS
jgi:hypothetical protein